MSAIGGGTPYVPQFKPSVNKKETETFISTVVKTETTTSTSGTSTKLTLNKEDFKALNKKGVDVEKVLKQIDPSIDVSKLKEFTFAFDGKTTKIELSSTQKDQFITALKKGLTENSEEDLSFTTVALKNKLSTFSDKPGEMSERFTTVKLGVSIGGSIGSSAGKDTALETPLGLSNTDGLAAELGLEGSVGVKSTVKNIDSGKVQISYEFQVLGEAKGKVSGFKVAQHEGNQEGSLGIGAKKTVTYTFNSKDDAIKFLDQKGKGMSAGDTTSANTYTVDKTGFEKVTTKSIQTSKSSKVEKTSEPSKGWFASFKNAVGNVFGFRSVQVSSFKKEKVGDESTKTFSLDTKTKFLSFEKRTTSTNLVVTKTKEATTGQEKFSGLFSLDMNIEKIKNNNDRTALINKLVGRFNQVADNFKSNSYGQKINLDREGIKKYITNTVDKLLHAEGFFKSDGKGLLQETKSGQKVSERSIDQFKYEGSYGIPSEATGGVGVGATLEVKATKSKMVRINIPLEMNGNDLKPKASDARVQLSEMNLIGIGVGAEVEIGSKSVAGAKAGAKIGFEKGSNTMRDVTDATDTATVNNTTTKLAPFTAKGTQALTKETEANTFKQEAKNLMKDYKTLKTEIKNIDSELKDLTSKLQEEQSKKNPNINTLMGLQNRIDDLTDTRELKVDQAEKKLDDAGKAISSAKNSIKEAKELAKDSKEGIKALYDNATQNKELRTEMSKAQNNELSITQDSKAIDIIDADIKNEETYHLNNHRIDI